MMLFPVLLWGQEQPGSSDIVSSNESTETAAPERTATQDNNFLLTPEAIKASAQAEERFGLSPAEHEAPDQKTDTSVQTTESDKNMQSTRKAKVRSLRRRNAKRGRKGRSKKTNEKSPAQFVEIAKPEPPARIVPAAANSNAERLLELADEAAAEIESMTALQLSAKEQPKEQLKPEIQVEPIIQKIELMAQIDGLEVPEQLIDSAPLVSGDRLLFTLRCLNQGITAERVVITYPVPPNVVYSQDSATGEETTVLYSVDGGYSFAQLEYLQAERKGRALASDDITHVRWIYNVAFETDQTSVLTFEGVFK